LPEGLIDGKLKSVVALLSPLTSKLLNTCWLERRSIDWVAKGSDIAWRREPLRGRLSERNSEKLIDRWSEAIRKVRCFSNHYASIDRCGRRRIVFKSRD
jgi:hypothetical protein